MNMAMAMVKTNSNARRADKGIVVKRLSTLLRSRWKAVGVLGLVSALVTWLVITNGVASANSSTNPRLAIAFQPWSSRANGVLGSVHFATLGAKSGQPVQQTSHRALRRDATEYIAMRNLAAFSDLQGGSAKASAQFHYVARLTRRDLLTNLWFIETQVEKGDVKGALKYFDQALKTSNDAPDLLFPILVKAFDDPELLDAIVDIVAPKPAWSAEFLTRAIDGSQSGINIHRALERLHQKNSDVSPGIVSHALYRLVALGNIDQAFALYSNFDSTARAKKPFIVDGGFEANQDTYPFGWSMVDNEAFSTERIRTRGEGGNIALSILATAPAQGAVLRQLLLLSPGHYKLTYDISVVRAARPSSFSWRVACATTGTKVANLPVPLVPQTGVLAALSVPAGCTAQWLELHVSLFDTDGESSAVVDNVALVRS